MTWRRIVYPGLIVLIALCLLPVYFVWWASRTAEANGCTLHEGFTNPCIVDGVDMGERLYTAFVSGWFMLVTLPVAAFAALALVVLAVLDTLRRLRRG